MSVFYHRQSVQHNPKNFICDICQTTYSSLLSLHHHKKEKNMPKETKEKNEKHRMKTNQSQRKAKQNHEQSMTCSGPTKQ